MGVAAFAVLGFHGLPVVSDHGQGPSEDDLLCWMVVMPAAA
jgi:hypothetical protein